MHEILRIAVECYAGHRGEEIPRVVTLGERRIDVAAILDQWLAPDHRYFKLAGTDDNSYIVRHDVETGQWELAMYERARER